MESNKITSLIFIFICALAICYFCISCSNVKKVPLDKSTMEESVQIELDLIADCLREFINLNANKSIISDFDLTLKTLEGERHQFKNRPDLWVLGKWVIKKIGNQKPIAQYNIDYGYESISLTLSLLKENGVYIVKDWEDLKLLGLEEIEEFEPGQQ